VYVESFPTLGGKRAISAGGGSEPQWRPDGGELFYIGPDGTLMAVAVDASDGLQVSRPMPLFRTPIAVSGELHTRRNHYAVAGDGQQFLIDAPNQLEESRTVLVNWQERLEP
jgi:hypothetical protein